MEAAAASFAHVAEVVNGAVEVVAAVAVEVAVVVAAVGTWRASGVGVVEPAVGSG